MNLCNIEGLEQAFWRRVQKAPGDGCWEWRLKPRANGYGHFTYHGIQGGAHRIAYALAYGAVPEGMFVCHRCDNRICVRPGHLFAGTWEDNVADMVAKERFSRKGRPRLRPPREAKRIGFTAEQVREIRRRARAGETRRSLCLAFGCKKGAMGYLLRGESYLGVRDEEGER